MSLIVWLIIIGLISLVVVLISLYILNKGRKKSYYHKEGFLDSLDRRYANSIPNLNPLNLLYRDKKSPSWFHERRSVLE